jgi:hypothetical protein
MQPKVDEAFKSFHYILYSSLTSAAWLKAAHGEEDFILNANSGLTVIIQTPHKPWNTPRTSIMRR